MEVICAACSTRCRLPDKKIPVGKSYIICPICKARINVFKGVAIGSIIKNLLDLRFLANTGDLEERFAEAGELWRVVNVIEPCPDKGRNRSCELDNRGRCPNQRLLVRLSRDTTLYKTCLYRNGRKIFDKGGRAPVGSVALTSGSVSLPTLTVDEKQAHAESTPTPK